MIKNIAPVSFKGTFIGPDNVLEMFKKRGWENPGNCAKEIDKVKVFADKLPEGDTVKFTFRDYIFDVKTTYIPGKASRKMGMRRKNCVVGEKYDYYLKSDLDEFKITINHNLRKKIKERDKTRYL